LNLDARPAAMIVAKMIGFGFAISEGPRRMTYGNCASIRTYTKCQSALHPIRYKRIAARSLS
jgi:hypothetical protein